MSFTVIVNEQEACALPAASLAKYVMVVSVPVVYTLLVRPPLTVQATLSAQVAAA
jgi:hypothetical protein